MKLKKFFGSILLAVAAGVIAVFIYTTFDQKEQTIVVQERPSMQYVNLPAAATAAPTDFIVAAETAVNAVVHVKTQSMRESRGNSFYEYFYISCHFCVLNIHQPFHFLMSLVDKGH